MADPVETNASGQSHVPRLPELQRALVAANRREAELQDFLEESVDALLKVDATGVILWANPAQLALLGATRDDLVGRTLFDLLDEPREASVVQRMLEGERLRLEPLVLRRIDGEPCAVIVSSHPQMRDGRLASVRCLMRKRERYLPGEIESRFAAIVEGSDDAIVSKTLEGIVTSWNAGAERIFGYTSEEMVGRSILTVIPPELKSEEDEVIAKVRANQRIDHYETTRLRKDGRRILVSLTVSPIRDAAGRIIGAAKIARDVTAQREADRINGVLAAIIQSSDVAIISEDLDGIITSWNPAAERLYGYTEADMVGVSVLRIVPDGLHHEEEHILAKVSAGERIVHFETVRQAKSGERISVSLAVSPILDRFGRVIGASKVARDLRGKRETERAIGSLAAIVESSDDAIISKDLEGVVTSWNPAAERLYGFAREEMIGQPMLKIIPPELYDEEARILAEIRAGRRIEHYETIRLRKDGGTVEVAITVSPVRDAAGRVIGASKIARNIGPQREAQRRKDEFLAILAHELRNPLAPVRTAIAMLRLPGVSADQQERLLAISDRQLQHMALLLNDLLDVSRITTGRVEMQTADVALSPLVAHAIDAARALITSRGHTLRVHEAAGDAWLHADPVRVTQILTNLLTNSAKYTDSGGNIELFTAARDGWVEIRVKDDGIGFSPEMKERLFTLFAQEKDALSRAAGGLGIGLALVREFVERHGGTVEAASEGPGKGSEFTVRLPLIETPGSRA